MISDTLQGVRTHLELWPEALPEDGSLLETPVALLLGRARMLRATGILALREERFVYVSRGSPVHVDSLLQDDASEIQLVNSGVLSAQAIDQTRAVAAEQGRGVGEALLSMGKISPNELYELKQRQSRQRLVSCFAWRDGAARFEERPIGGEIVPIAIDLAQVLTDGVAAHYDRRRLARELAVGESHRVYLTGPPEAGRSLALGALEVRILSRASARPSVASLAMDLRADDTALHRALFVLFHLGLVGFDLAADEVAKPPQPVPDVIQPRMPQRSPGPVAPPAPPRPAPRPAIPSPASRPAARTPAPRPATPKPPSRPAMPSAPPTADPEGPEAPAAVLPPLGRPKKSASSYLEESEMARDAGDLVAALLAMRYAHLVEPNNAVIAADLALLFVLVDERAYGREAGRLAKETRRANPALPIPYVVLGVLLEQIRDSARAEQMYRQALSRDPECDEARARLERLLTRWKG